MKPFLMGTETEYAVSGRSAGGPTGPEEAFRYLNEAMRQERRWLPDASGGWAAYFEHGGRVYMDSGGHPEHATPECGTPAEVALYDKAGERLFAPGARARPARAARPGDHRRQEQRRPDPRRRGDLGLSRVVHDVGARRQGGRAAGAARRQPTRSTPAPAACPAGPGCEGFELSQRARAPAHRHRHRHDQQPADLRHAAAQAVRPRAGQLDAGPPDRQGFAACPVRHLPDLRHHRAAVPDGERRPQGRPGAGAGRPGEGGADHRRATRGSRRASRWPTADR